MEYTASDPPPLRFSPPPGYPSPFSSSQPAANSPTHPQLQLNHPPYEEMIRTAVRNLNDKDGSSRQKIARYIETEFHVPKTPLHEFELTTNLKQMKNFGQLVLVRHSYMLPLPPPPPLPPQPLPQIQTQSSLGPSVGPFVPPPVGPSVPSVSDGPKRRPGRPPKLQPVVVSRSPALSPPVGFAAFSPKQSGVPTTSLFGGLAPASYQFSTGPSVSTGLVTNASTMAPVNGPANGVPTMTIASGPVTVPSIGPVSNIPLTSSVSEPVNNVHPIGPVSCPVNNVTKTASVNNILATGLAGGSAGNCMPNLSGLVSMSVSTVPSTSAVSGTVSHSEPVSDPVAWPNEQMNESAGVVGAGLESSTLFVSAANDPAVNNDGPLLVAPTGPIVLNNDGPSTVLGKRGRGRPPKINGGPKKIWSKPAMYGRRGRRGRPRNVAIPVSTISLRPRGRPRKNLGGEIVTFDGANDGGVGGALPVENIPQELPDRSLGRPNKDVPDAASLTSEIQLMAYQGLKAKIDYYNTVIKSAVTAIRPSVNQTEVTALGALQTLEDLTNMDLISVPVNAPSVAALVQKAPVDDDMNTMRNVQGAPAADLNAPVVQDAVTDTIQISPSTAEDTHITDAETAEVTLQSDAVPVQEQQEPPLQS
ncbi:uncharacterized protein LOC141712122 [Apium graveolens]|uniref:uncharacterized protein LOC141712122 n=1 Tax=Apium graveolens TaxID=4045 RepID=UPI003D7C06F7